MLFLGGRLPKAQYDDPDQILEQEEIDEESMNGFMQNSGNPNSGILKHLGKGQQTVLSAKLSPANSMSGLKYTGGPADPTNKSVVEDSSFKDNDSLHQMNQHRRHRSNKLIRPVVAAGRAMMKEPSELDQISSINLQ